MEGSKRRDLPQPPWPEERGGFLRSTGVRLSLFGASLLQPNYIRNDKPRRLGREGGFFQKEFENEATRLINVGM